MKATITHYKYVVRITYSNGHSRDSYFAHKKEAEKFAKAMRLGCDCIVKIIEK